MKQLRNLALLTTLNTFALLAAGNVNAQDTTCDLFESCVVANCAKADTACIQERCLDQASPALRVRIEAVLSCIEEHCAGEEESFECSEEPCFEPQERYYLLCPDPAPSCDPAREQECQCLLGESPLVFCTPGSPGCDCIDSVGDECDPTEDIICECNYTICDPANPRCTCSHDGASCDPANNADCRCDYNPFDCDPATEGAACLCYLTADVKCDPNINTACVCADYDSNGSRRESCDPQISSNCYCNEPIWWDDKIEVGPRGDSNSNSSSNNDEGCAVGAGRATPGGLALLVLGLAIGLARLRR